MSRLRILFLPLVLAACASPPPRTVYVTPAPRYAPPPPDTSTVVTVYEEPPISEPEPVAIRWAPPPMLVEALPPPPYPDAIWVGGYWVWRGNWVWAHGHWAQPPRPRYYWVHPYYENRGGEVIFVNGYWSAPGEVFVPPPPTLRITLAVVAAGVRPGPPPVGPVGVFVPPPPGSRQGIIVPAPIGTPPAVVISAPPVVNVGMRIEHNVNVHNTVVNNNVTNVTNITNVTNVTVVAPASAVATGRPVSVVVPAQAHVAAAMRPVVNAPAPKNLAQRADVSPEPGHVGQVPLRAAPAATAAPSPAPTGNNPHMDGPAVTPRSAPQAPSWQSAAAPDQKPGAYRDPAAADHDLRSSKLETPARQIAQARPEAPAPAPSLSRSAQPTAPKGGESGLA